MISKYLHAYNRGVDKRRIFSSDADRLRFLETARVVRLRRSPRLSVFLDQIRSGVLLTEELDIEKQFGPPIVDILAFVLMPNHFHFLLKELAQEGISKFAQRLGNSYTRYFNKKYDRRGRLFESTYRSVLVETDEQLIHLSRYIHINPVLAKNLSVDFKSLPDYRWSSYPTYLGKESDFCKPDEVIEQFTSPDKYSGFVKGQIEEKIELPSSLLIDADD